MWIQANSVQHRGRLKLQLDLKTGFAFQSRRLAEHSCINSHKKNEILLFVESDILLFILFNIFELHLNHLKVFIRWTKDLLINSVLASY